MIYILVFLLSALAILLMVVAMQPATFHVTRSLAMAAAPEKVFVHVNDLHKWDGWSPWAKLDPNAKNYFEGPGAGVGATMRWEGNMKVGSGRMTITESQPNEFVRFRLDFLKPMQATNIAEFIFRAEGNQTNVTWSMSGKIILSAKSWD